jgi:hypothetical protein
MPRFRSAERTGERTMSDDLTNRGAQDRARISLGEEHEVRYWTGALGVNETRLREAVREVGNSADAVRTYLTEA